jgi:hypothetical protein
MSERSDRDVPIMPFLHKNRLCGVNSIWQGYNPFPVPFSEELANEINKEAVKAFSSDDPLAYIASDLVTTVCGNEFKRWVCAVEAYITSYKPLIHLSDLLKGVLDINFATRLKKTRTWAWTRANSMEPSEDDGLDEFVKVPLHGSIEDLGQVFNYRYWFFWEEPPTDDWKYSQIPVPEVSEELKNEFARAVYYVTPDQVPAVEPETILTSITSSGAIAPDGTRSKVWRLKEIEELNSFSSDPLVGHLTHVAKCAGEMREAVTLSVPQSNSVKFIEAQVARIAKDTMYSAYGMSPGEFESELRKFYDRNTSFLNRDLTKEGITKPRWVLHTILKVFREKYPNCKCWDYSSIYNDMFYVIDGKRVSTERGHGLGMANALTTIMQCAAFQLFLWEAESDLITTPEALFYNDDGSVGATDPSAILAYEQEEEPLLQSLGLMKKNEKTYMGPVGVLCEVYSDAYLNKKDSYWRYVRRIPFSSPCLMVAKECWYLTSSPWNGKEPGLIERLANFWGYEYGPEEYFLPWWAGGWQKPKVYGVDTSFLMDGIEATQMMARGYRVGPVRQKPVSLKESKTIYKSPLPVIFGPCQLPLEVEKAFCINQPRSAVSARYSKGGSRSDIENWLQFEMRRRYNAWRTPAKEYSLEEFYRMVVDKHPWVDILPPEGCYKTVPLESVTIFKEGGPARLDQPNQYLGAMSWFANKYIKSIIPYPEWPGREIQFKPLTVEQMDYREEQFFVQGGAPTYFVNEFESPGDVVFTRRSWNNDYAVSACLKTLTQSDAFMEPIHLSLGAQINRKEEANLRTIEYWSSPNLYYIWQIWGRTIPILYLNGKLTDDDVKEIVSPISEEGPLTPVLDRSGMPPDFWAWYSSGMKMFEPFSLYHMYNEAGSALVMSDTYKLFFTEQGLRGTSNLVRPPEVSPVMAQFFETHLSFQKEKLGDVFIWRPPDRPDPLDDMSNDGEGLGFMWD